MFSLRLVNQMRSDSFYLLEVHSCGRILTLKRRVNVKMILDWCNEYGYEFYWGYICVGVRMICKYWYRWITSNLDHQYKLLKHHMGCSDLRVKNIEGWPIFAMF